MVGIEQSLCCFFSNICKALKTVDEVPSQNRPSRREPSEDLLVFRQQICYVRVDLQHNLNMSQMLQLMLMSAGGRGAVEGGLV